MTIENSNLRAAAVLISSTMLLILSHYHKLFGDETLSSLIFYFLIPLAIILVLFRDAPQKFGLTFGDSRKGILFCLLGTAFMAVIIALLAQLEEFHQYYRSGIFEHPEPVKIAEFALRQGVYMFSWEFMFRGYMLFGLRERFGSLAIWIQAIPFAIMHLGKLELETLSTMFGGAAFAYIDLETGSIFPSVVIHWAIYVMMVFAATTA